MVAGTQSVNVEKVLPLSDMSKKLFIGTIAYREAEGARVQANFADHENQISAHATGAILDSVGIAMRILIHGGRIVHRNPCVHGKIIIGVDSPMFLSGISVVRAMRTLHDWTTENSAALYDVTNAVIHAGGFRQMMAIVRWFEKGSMGLRSKAASLLVGDLGVLGKWP